MKTQIEIDIPDGWEFVRWGKPRIGEHYVRPDGRIADAIFDFQEDNHPVVRPAWQWPAFLKCEWIAKDPNGYWYAYKKEPTLCSYDWQGECLATISDQAFDFTPPPCHDWRQSKRRRPS